MSPCTVPTSHQCTHDRCTHLSVISYTYSPHDAHVSSVLIKHQSISDVQRAEHNSFTLNDCLLYCPGDACHHLQLRACISQVCRLPGSSYCASCCTSHRDNSIMSTPCQNPQCMHATCFEPSQGPLGHITKARTACALVQDIIWRSRQILYMWIIVQLPHIFLTHGFCMTHACMINLILHERPRTMSLWHKGGIYT